MTDLSFEKWIATPEYDLRSYDEWVYEDGKPIPVHPLQNAVQKEHVLTRKTVEISGRKFKQMLY